MPFKSGPSLVASPTTASGAASHLSITPGEAATIDAAIEVDETEDYMNWLTRRWRISGS